MIQHLKTSTVSNKIKEKDLAYRLHKSGRKTSIIIIIIINIYHPMTHNVWRLLRILDLEGSLANLCSFYDITSL